MVRIEKMSAYFTTYVTLRGHVVRLKFLKVARSSRLDNGKRREGKIAGREKKAPIPPPLPRATLSSIGTPGQAILKWE